MLKTQNTETQENDAPLIKLVNKIILDAAKRNPDAIRLTIVETGDSKSFTLFDKRGSGPFVVAEKIPARLASMIIARIKVVSNMSIIEHNKVQKGEWDFEAGGILRKLTVTSLPSLATVQGFGNESRSIEEIIIEFAS